MGGFPIAGHIVAVGIVGIISITFQGAAGDDGDGAGGGSFLTILEVIAAVRLPEGGFDVVYLTGGEWDNDGFLSGRFSSFR